MAVLNVFTLVKNYISEFAVISMQIGFALEVVVSASSAPRQCWHSAREEVEDWRSSIFGLESGPCDLAKQVVGAGHAGQSNCHVLLL